MCAGVAHGGIRWVVFHYLIDGFIPCEMGCKLITEGGVVARFTRLLDTIMTLFVGKLLEGTLDIV